MKKRMTDMDKWDTKWFNELPQAYKLFWVYLLDKCDYAGVWEKSFRVASFYIGETITEEEAKQWLKDRIMEMPNGNWWIRDFCKLQYKKLNPKNVFHKNAIDRLEEHGLLKYVTGMPKS